MLRPLTGYTRFFIFEKMTRKIQNTEKIATTDLQIKTIIH